MFTFLNYEKLVKLQLWTNSVGKCAKTWNHNYSTYRIRVSTPIPPFNGWKL